MNVHSTMRLIHGSEPIRLPNAVAGYALLLTDVRLNEDIKTPTQSITRGRNHRQTMADPTKVYHIELISAMRPQIIVALPNQNGPCGRSAY